MDTVVFNWISLAKSHVFFFLFTWDLWGTSRSFYGQIYVKHLSLVIKTKNVMCWLNAWHLHWSSAEISMQNMKKIGGFLIAFICETVWSFFLCSPQCDCLIVPSGTQLYNYFLQQCHNIRCLEQVSAASVPFLLVPSNFLVKHKLGFYRKRKTERGRRRRLGIKYKLFMGPAWILERNWGWRRSKTYVTFQVFFCLFLCNTLIKLIHFHGEYVHEECEDLRFSTDSSCLFLAWFVFSLVYISRALPSRNVWVSSPLHSTPPILSPSL